MVKQVKITSKTHYLEEVLSSLGQFEVTKSAKLEIVDKGNFVEVGSVRFSKPLILKDLISAINNAAIPEKIEFKEFTLFPKLRSLQIQESEVSLTEKENAILLYLIHSTNHTANKNDILKDVWGVNEQTETKTLESHVYRLRQKLEAYDLKNWLILDSEFVRLVLTKI